MTSYLFLDGKFSLERLKAASSAVGKDNLVVDVRWVMSLRRRGVYAQRVMVFSCRRRDDKWLVAMNKWQTITDMEVCKGKSKLYSYTAEADQRSQIHSTCSPSIAGET